jgi:hypothetical protein
LITDLPEHNGNDAIIVLVDKLTKMAHFVPCVKTIDANGMAKVLLHDVVRLHGFPLDVISDRDPRFMSDVWKSLLTFTGVRQHLTSPFHPQSDGQTERMNRSLIQVLRAYVNDTQSDWSDWLPTAEFAYNDSIHSSTGYTPFYLNYGIHPYCPSQLLFLSLRGGVASIAKDDVAHMHRIIADVM